MSHDTLAMSLPTPTNSKNSDLGSTGYEKHLQSILDENIRNLEKFIIELKRTRNSLSKVNKLPVEVLGSIFHQNVMPEGNFDGLCRGSHNFLLVCHHWFEVASSTPQVWSFWGNTSKDWARYCLRSKTAPLDLVLNLPLFPNGDPDIAQALLNVLQDRANRDTIRRVHLRAPRAIVLKSILSSLTSEGREVRSNRIESLILWNQNSDVPVDVSDFFACYRFPKLENLHLDCCTISSWDNLISRTGALTYLSLGFTGSTPSPTISQLFYMLKSNPLLQDVFLSYGATPKDDETPSYRVALQHLKCLRLNGHLRPILRLLDRLDHPAILDIFTITLVPRCTVTEVSKILVPYFRNHYKRHDRPVSELGLEINYWGHRPDRTITLRVRNVAEAKDSVAIDELVEVDISLDGVCIEERIRAALQLIAHVPQEELVYFRAVDRRAAMGSAYSRLPNLKTLHLEGIHLPATFPEHYSDKDNGVLPALQNLILERVTVDNGNWSPLTTFLAGRASSGKPLNTLKILKVGPILPEVISCIAGVVQEFDVCRDVDICSYIFGSD